MLKFVFAVVISLVSLSTTAKSIVVLGDSISAAYGIEVGQGWVALVQGKLQEKYSDYTVNNESISGDTSAGGLARIDGVLSRHKPSVVIIELGANDGLRGLSPAELKNNLAEIARRAKKSDAKVLLLSMRIPPNYGKRYTEMFYNVYPQLSKELSVPYVPFILEDVALVKQLMQQDGLHPNEKAQAVIVEKIWPHLVNLLK
ncbi:esterase TesA [Methyloglobulus morosus KoM1]|uniref:Esterase TesA n=1 Tax=Methyloglobulus morosus KoM1 TaxID=1116472 RepID=V5BQM9_9GAMM|nr:arylesterase [Methyloglobulus morosus]ESS66873.1 esterase TesA [Methyloglobulus morosus KoM1]